MQYSRDLVQGGLDVPCHYQFYSENEDCLKVVKELLESASCTTMAVNNLEKFQTVKNAPKPGDSITCSNEDSIVLLETKPKDVCYSIEKQTTCIKTEEPNEVRRKIDTSTSSNGNKEWLRMGV